MTVYRNGIDVNAFNVASGEVIPATHAIGGAMSDWQKNIPREIGHLPGGGVLRRTEPSGAGTAGIAFLGVYPAATATQQINIGKARMTLPTEVEGESFAPESRSGEVFEKHYLGELGLTRSDVLVTDMLPYYLANTTATGKNRRSMADNVQAFEAATGARTGIRPRPLPEALVQLAREMPGNVGRLTEYFSRYRFRLLFTLGTEPAAFIRGIEYRRMQSLIEDMFYSAPAMVRCFGIDVAVVHLVHPHLFIKANAKWTARHLDWCVKVGRALVAPRFPPGEIARRTIR